MNDFIKVQNVKDSIINLKGINVIPDFLVAKLYGVETKDINRAVKNNPDKFPEGYIVISDTESKKQLVKNFHQFNIKHSSASIKLFTEKALYMLATILKSPVATQTTLAIVETFAQVRELKEEISATHAQGDGRNQTSRIEKIGALIADIMMPELKTSETEASMEVNLVFSKFTYTVKRTRMQDLKEKLTQIAERMLDNGFSEEEIKKYLK